MQQQEIDDGNDFKELSVRFPLILRLIGFSLNIKKDKDEKRKSELYRLLKKYI